MSLEDEFAARAMQTLLARAAKASGGDTYRMVARQAYSMAQAMIREKFRMMEESRNEDQ